jgi:leucyl aminopeptidase
LEGRQAMAFALIDAGEAGAPIPTHLIASAALADWLAARGPAARVWAEANGYTAGPGKTLLLPGDEGRPAGLLVGLDAAASIPEQQIWALAGLSETLPPGAYRLAIEPGADAATRIALGWALGSYVFSRYKARKRASAQLVWPANSDRARVIREAEATFLGRDLINTPAGDLLPSALAAAAAELARRHEAAITIIVGDDLLAADYPAIHAVGRASVDAPRLIDLRWGSPDHPRVTLVGKGVCFDSGGLDIKAASSMKSMKKDMGGAAAVLSVAHMVMAARLKVQLRVLVPAVENAISGNAYHPLDVIKTRKGLTVEVGNTDAEGRLILCDALAEADREAPALLIDSATLTREARLALGPDLPALFTRHDQLADELIRQAAAVADPLYRLPLWSGYRKVLDSTVADLVSIGDTATHGAITAALFLAEFVAPETPWIHFDAGASNATTRPGRPEGGDPRPIRALYGLIEAHQAR